MSDDRLNPLKGLIGGGFRASQHTARVENIEPFVFHRTHIKVAYCNDHEDIEIVLTTVDFLVPSHCSLQALKCITSAV